MGGRGKQAWITILHYTCRAVDVSSWSRKSTSVSGKAHRSALYGGGWASWGHTQYREYIQMHWILTEHGTTSDQHRLPWCWHRWVFHLDCDPPRGVACQEGQNLNVHSVDTTTKNRPAAWNYVGRSTQGNLQARLLKPVCNTGSCHLHRQCYMARSMCWDSVQRWVAAVHARVPRSLPLSLFATGNAAAAEEYCGSWSESAGERPPWWCALRASCGCLKTDCELPYMEATLSCLQQSPRDVVRWTWRLKEPVYPHLWALT